MQLPYRKPGKYAHTPLDPFITQDKLDQLTRKLARLQNERPLLAKEVARLAELGDFSENVEYQLAKGKLRAVNQRILVLENQLKQAQIISSHSDSDIIELGDRVTLESEGRRKTYQILGSAETDPDQGIISHHSPIGEALIGKKVGETIAVDIGKKKIEYLIIQKER
ncbi:MAG TPA: GreA/GreB family elongation factor [Candidatus Magasanikbacteria bacterium]|nr:GreA/GreB family elongation factor [Candidatus Magasanikbacteria bacterium]